MATSTKLLLGFGTLILVLVASSVATVLRVRSIEREVNEMATARDLSAAARQLEINTLGYALNVRSYLQIGDPKLRDIAAAEITAAESSLREYERLAATNQQREMAAHFSGTWNEFKGLGQSLLNIEDRQAAREELTNFLNLRMELENLLDEQMQADAVALYERHAGEAMRDIRAVVFFALTLLVIGTAIAVVTSWIVSRGIIRSEREVFDGREKLRVTLASIGDAVITTDSDGRVGYLNAIAESLTGWSNKEVNEQPLENVFHIINETTRETVENPALRALREGIIVGLANHTVLIAKDGSERPIDDSAAPIRDEKGIVAGVVLTFRDVTEQRKAEMALNESEQRFRSLFESGPVAIFSCDRDGVIQNYNRRAAELWGREPKCGDINERYCGSMELYRPDGNLLPHSESPIVQVLQTGIPAKDVDVYIQRPDGSRIAVVVNFSPLKNILGEVTGAITAFYDVTEQRKAADELRQLTADLSEADHRKNDFLAMLAHELRNPLAPIRNALEIMRMSGKGGAELRSASEMMERQVGQLVRLVDDLLDVSRITRGKIELRKGRIELASTVNHAFEAALPSCEKGGVHLEVTLPAEPIYLNGDPTRLAQVIGNLLNNSCKFTDKGGRIDLVVALENKHAVIRVRDTGIGIAKHQLRNVFDMFVQADTSLERADSGLGIGLTLVKNLVELHGGTVDVFSEGLGKGSEFTVRLPVADEMPAIVTNHEPAAENPETLSIRRILVVDDNVDSASSLAMLMKLAGHEVQMAHDGIEAVEAAEKFRPNVILLDIGLPKLNGYEAARKIRQLPLGNEIVLVALTGWGQEEDRRKSKESGFNAHLVKPVDHSELRKILDSLGAAV